MLIHECVDCNSLSINRIAADDDPESIISVFQSSLMHGHHQRFKQEDIEMLGVRQSKIVYEQLYGQSAALLVSN